MLSVLEREVYSEAEAARYLRMPQSTLNFWLEGGVRKGRRYEPVIRVEPKGVRAVTWAEFVEAGLLRQYRKLNVPMKELRAFIGLLRESFGVPYPLAHQTPFVAGRRLVVQAQQEAGLDREFWLVAPVDGQPMLLPPSEAYVERVTWEDNIAARWRPDSNQDSPVRIDPDIRFGRPAIKGISTETIWEQDAAGVDIDEIADTYQLEVPDVRWALSYENVLRAA